jgi:hypothetical protein
MVFMEKKAFMRQSCILILVVGALCLPGARPAAAQRPGLPDGNLTAGEIAARLRSAADGIQAAAGGARRDETGGIAAVRSLGDSIASLRFAARTSESDAPAGEAEAVLREGLVVLTVAEDFAASFKYCMREPAGPLLEAFAANVRRVREEAQAMRAGGPGILRAAATRGDVAYGIVAGVARMFTIEGPGLQSDKCGQPSATLGMSGQDPVRVRATARGEDRVELAVPQITDTGLYELSIRLRRKRLLLFCGSTTVRAWVAVRPAPFQVHYRVSTRKAEQQEIVWNAGELKLANANCDRDTTVATTFRLPEGWTYESHRWEVFLDSGSVKETEEVTNEGVLVRYRVPPRSGPFCTGPQKMIHGRMEISGTRTSWSPGPSVDAVYPRRAGFGEHLALTIDAEGPVAIPAGSEVTIEVSFVRPDGIEEPIPIAIGQGRLFRSGPAESSLEWLPESTKLRITTPSQPCRILEATS